jgi:hypothetical protein
MSGYKNKNKILTIISITSLFFLSGCFPMADSSPKDLAPIINGKHDVAKVYYPSTDHKVSAVVVTKSGDVYYYRANGFGDLKDEKLLFNIHDMKLKDANKD